jgi:hypothetical protein
MGAIEDATELAAFTGRGPGSNAGEISRSRRDARIEPFWCRPNWALAHAWHAALGLAGSLVSVSSPKVGGGLLLAALLSVLADAMFGVSPGRRLTLERASQNVASTISNGEERVRLIVTANYDAGRAGLAHRDGPRRAAARLRQLTGGATPGWAGWLAILLLVLLAVAIARADGTKQGAAIAALQLIPTVALVLTFALLVDLALSDPGPAAGDNATGVATALALTRALDAFPPANVAVELVLTGAGDCQGLGLRHHLRARRPKLNRADVVVLGLAACGAGAPRWWTSDGPLVPLRYLPRLSSLAAGVATDEAHLQARPHRGRGTGPGLPARQRGLPAITIGCLDADGLAPRSHSSADTADTLDEHSIERALQFALAMVDAIDGEVARVSASPRGRRRGGGDDGRQGLLGRWRERRREDAPRAATPA